MSLTCAGCPNGIPNKSPYLTCSLCTSNYDLDCANVSEARFYNTMTLEHKKRWKCQMCHCKKAKTDNTNSPIRTQNQIATDELSNVTFRQKSYKYTNDSMDSSCELSMLGDTLHTDPANNTMLPVKNMESTNKNQDHCPLPITQALFTMEELNNIVQKNNTALVEALKNTIHEEIQRAISQLKTELTQKTENLNIEL